MNRYLLPVLAVLASGIAEAQEIEASNRGENNKNILGSGHSVATDGATINHGLGADELLAIFNGVLELQKEVAPEDAANAEKAVSFILDRMPYLEEEVERYRAEAEKFRVQIAQMEEGPEKALLETAAARQAESDFESAEAALRELVERGQDSIEAVSEAHYRLGLIAEIKVRLLDATEQFVLSAQIHPSFERLDKAVEFLTLTADYKKAETFARDLIAFAERSGGQNSQLAAAARYRMGEVLQKQGRLFEAETQMTAAVEADAAIPGPRNPQMVERMAGRATVLYELGSLSAAEEVMDDAIAMAESLDEPDDSLHPQLWRARANILADQGQYEEALATLEDARARVLRAGGEGRPDHAQITRGIAEAQSRLERVEAALETAEEALDLTERAFGKRHPEYAESLLTLIRIRERRYGDANTLAAIEEVLSITEQSLGRAHPSYAKQKLELGVELLRAGQKARGRELVDSALAQIEALYGSDHPEYAFALQTAALARLDAGDPAAGVDLIEKSIAVLDAAYGPRNLYSAQAAAFLGLNLVEAGRPHDAVERLERAAEVQLAITGLEDGDYALTLAYLAGAHVQLGQFDAAERHATKALDLARSAHDFPTIGQGLANVLMGKLNFDRGRFADARPYLEAAGEILDQVAGGANIATVNKLSLAAVYSNLNDDQKALTVLTPVLDELRASKEENALLFAYALNNSAAMHLSMGDRNAAEKAFREALVVLETLPAGSGRSLQSTLYINMGDLLLADDRAREAIPYLEKAVELTSEINGPLHPDTMRAIAMFAGALSETGRYDEAERYARKAADAARERLEPGSGSYIVALVALKDVLEDRDRRDAALAVQEELVEALESSDLESTSTYIAQLNNLALLRQQVGELDGAIEAFRKLVGDVKPDEASLSQRVNHRTNLASLLARQGDMAGAGEFYRAALTLAETGDDLEDQSEALSALAGHYEDAGNHEAAESHFLQAVDRAMASSAGPNMATAYRLFSLSNYYAREARFREALQTIDQALFVVRFAKGTDDPDYGGFLAVKAMRQRDLKDHADAEATMRDAMAVDRATYEEDHAAHGKNLMQLSTIKRAAGDLPAAIDLIEQALKLYEEHKLADSVMAIQRDLAISLMDLDRFDGAEEVLEKLQASSSPRSKSEIEGHAHRDLLLGDLHLAKGEYEKAIMQADMAALRASEHLPNDTYIASYAGAIRGRALAYLSRFEEASATIADARSFAESQKTKDPFDLFRVRHAEAALKFLRRDHDADNEAQAVLDFYKERLGENHPDYRIIQSEFEMLSDGT